MDIEKLKDAKQAAWSKYASLSEPANVAYKEYEAARDALEYAELYEKARRHVMRDLLKSAGAIKK